MRANVALACLCVSLLHAAASFAQLTSAKAGPVVDGLDGVLVTVAGP